MIFRQISIDSTSVKKVDWLLVLLIPAVSKEADGLSLTGFEAAAMFGCKSVAALVGI